MDYLFVNARIYTMAHNNASAMYVKEGKIEKIGNEEEVRNIAEPDAKVIDLEGRCVLPGFIDSHCHLLSTGEVRRKMDLSKARSSKDLINIGKKYIEDNKIPDGEPVLGFGFNHNLFDSAALPEKELADEISKRHPVLLERVCCHVGTINNYAIEKLGISRETKIDGGELGIREDGELNGLVWENALTEVKDRLLKKDISYIENLLQEASEYVNSLGITSLHSNDVGEEDWDVFKRACRNLESEGKLTVRIFEEISSPKAEDLAKLIAKGIKTGAGTDFMKVGNVKIFTDGSLGAHSAAMLEDYSDMPGERGIAIYADQQELNELTKTANMAGLQVAIHAIGDKAAMQCVEAFEYASTFVNKDMRNRIVHCQIADDSLLARMVKASINVDIQPPFAVTDWEVAEQSLGDRCLYSYRWKKMRDLGIRVGGGSDSPVETVSPVWGIHCAVNRCNEKGSPKGGWHPDEKLSVKQAIELYTKGAAYLAFEEENKGTLENGKLADFVVLSEDIFKVPPMEIQNIKILKTVIGGKICYEV